MNFADPFGESANIIDDFFAFARKIASAVVKIVKCGSGSIELANHVKKEHYTTDDWCASFLATSLAL